MRPSKPSVRPLTPDDVGEMERPFAGVVARIYDILVGAEEFAEDR